ncbi:MAG: hypothetical protein NTV93_03785 [Verrucomicrobia bacterium]|nr:hypothetical protein [Verrucomicrobiota bacterium]
MSSNRKPILIVSGVLVLALALVCYFWPDGLITLDFRDAPVSNVISSIERQGHVRIGTNVPLETLVTMQMKRVPLMDALETLSVRIEGELRVVFAGATTKTQAVSALEELQSGKPSDNWAVAWFPSMGMIAGDTPPDPRSLAVKPEAGEKNDLQSALQQVAMKSGVMTAVPKDWNPDAKMPTNTAPASNIVKQLINSSGGQVQESFLIIARGGRDGGRDGGPPGQGGPGGDRGGPPGGQRAGRDAMNPEWLAQRAEAAIAQLPPEERLAAKADFDAMRKFWDVVRALPDDQRRAKMEEFFNRPDVQDKMEQRQTARDSRQSPQQREKRMKAYIERKRQMIANPPKQ